MHTCCQRASCFSHFWLSFHTWRNINFSTSTNMKNFTARSAGGFNYCSFSQPGQKVCFHNCSAIWGFSLFRCSPASRTTPRSNQHFQSLCPQLHNFGWSAKYNLMCVLWIHIITFVMYGCADCSLNTLFHSSLIHLIWKHFVLFWCYFGPIPKFPVPKYHYNGMQSQHPP